MKGKLRTWIKRQLKTKYYMNNRCGDCVKLLIYEIDRTTTGTENRTVYEGSVICPKCGVKEKRVLIDSVYLKKNFKKV